MAALMTTEMDNTDKITKYISDVKQHQVVILPPDVNYSQKRFSVEMLSGSDAKKNQSSGSNLSSQSLLQQHSELKVSEATGVKGIRFGLEAIKGVGSIAVDAILIARKTKIFNSVLDLCSRVAMRKLNKKVLEALCLAGALDSISEVNRASLFSSLEKIIEHVGGEQQERELGQASFFDSFSSDQIKLFSPSETLFKSEPDWPAARKLTLEKEVVGFYVSGHPMDGWQPHCEDWLGWSTLKIKTVAQNKANQKKNSPLESTHRNTMDWQPGGFSGRFRTPKTEVKLAGILCELKEVTTKKGQKMAFAQFEDLKGKVEVIFFPEAYSANQNVLKRSVQEAEAMILEGEVEFGEEVPKIIVKSLHWLSEVYQNQMLHVTLRLSTTEVTLDQLRELKRKLIQYRGKSSVRLEFEAESFRTYLDLPKNLNIEVNPQTLTGLNQIFGKEVIRLQLVRVPASQNHASLS